MDLKTLNALRRIRKLFGQIDKELQQLDDVTFDEIHKRFEEHHSLNHCARWGLQASEELIRCGYCRSYPGSPASKVAFELPICAACDERASSIRIITRSSVEGQSAEAKQLRLQLLLSMSEAAREANPL